MDSTPEEGQRMNWSKCCVGKIKDVGKRLFKQYLECG